MPITKYPQDAVDAANRLIVVGPAADGAAAAGSPVVVSGVDAAGNVQQNLADPDGRQELVPPGAFTKRTYSASALTGTLAANATDVFTLAGSATQTVRVKRIILRGSLAVAAIVAVSIIKRSVADTAGTAGTPTVVPHDSNNAAGTAVMKSYTANPTLGTAVGEVRSLRMYFSNAVNITETDIVFDGQGIVLRGTAQQLVVNLNGLVAQAAMSCTFEWTEEN